VRTNISDFRNQKNIFLKALNSVWERISEDFYLGVDWALLAEMRYRLDSQGLRQ
jgi:hypothetical protein